MFRKVVVNRREGRLSPSLSFSAILDGSIETSPPTVIVKCEFMPEETTSPTISSGARGVSRFWFRALWLGVVIYWVAMFVGSHTPPPLDPRTVAPYDKLIHFSAFAGLSFLLLAAISSSRKAPRRILVFVAVVVIGYGALDELTQPLVGRTRDGYDLAADSVGVLAGITSFLIVRAFMLRRGAAR